ncbi:MAG: hypothetical protein AAF125_11060 [Chloroflexota bacterium]
MAVIYESLAPDVALLRWHGTLTGLEVVEAVAEAYRHARRAGQRGLVVVLDLDEVVRLPYDVSALRRMFVVAPILSGVVLMNNTEVGTVLARTLKPAKSNPPTEVVLAESYDQMLDIAHGMLHHPIARRNAS